MERDTKHYIHPFFLKRYSPKKFFSSNIDEDDILALIEAASSAPSSFNEQPWRFVFGSNDKFHSILFEKNLEWCKDVETFALVCSENDDELSVGISVGFLIYEAYNRGIQVHAMGGFDKEIAEDVFELDGLKPLIVLAFGYADEMEYISDRKDIQDLIINKG